MDTTTVAQPAHQSTTEPQPAYVLRGLGLFELHRDEILESYQGGGKWLIPSGTETDRHYEVRVGIRRQSCECQGYARHDHCSHLIAAQRVARLSGVCDGCGQRVWRRELVEVGEDNLTAFEGDLLCRPCGRAHGAL